MFAEFEAVNLQTLITPHCWRPHTSFSPFSICGSLHFIQSRVHNVHVLIVCFSVHTHLSVLLLCLGHSRRAGQLILHLLHTHRHTQNTTTLDNTLPQCFTTVAEMTLKARLGADSIINETFCSAAGRIKMSEALVFPLSTAPFFGPDDSVLFRSI